ncbi:SDR family NAD(P)-dependent oxidoreductase [Candidatus Epulonipiscium viviparus]|uniref:SDR family NAD(P)-dependent oxidoreductase n=1 Tax=Candidatus Epulonipiscium viviparus TaxID=420336 RepID=UPI002738136B|nr:SDR family oxidoreductase [Candidatus Epulopiscium viviparus]
MKNCIITGGSSGIGFDMATQFIEKGYRVIVLDIKDCANKEVTYIHTDISDAVSVANAFKAIKEQFQTAHILINDAAIASHKKALVDSDAAEFDLILDTNLRGAYLCCKEFINLNKGESYGRIINISSTRFHQNEANCELYGMSKGGLISLTNSLCISLTGTPITVNAISPGWICTANYDELDFDDHKMHPSNRVGKPRDISNVCLFLAEEENDFINGANIIVDGGMTKKMIY